MSYKIKESRAFEDLEIRDTSDHLSPIIDNSGFAIKTIIIENSLNQDITCTCLGSVHEDFSESFVIGAFPHSASTNGYQTCESYIPFWKLQATCATAPTSGLLNVYIEGIR